MLNHKMFNQKLFNKKIVQKTIVTKCTPRVHIMMQKIARLNEQDKINVCMTIKNNLITQYENKDIIYSIPCDSPLLKDLNLIHNLYDSKDIDLESKIFIRNTIGYHMVLHEDNNDVINFLEKILEYYDCI